LGLEKDKAWDITFEGTGTKKGDKEGFCKEFEGRQIRRDGGFSNNRDKKMQRIWGKFCKTGNDKARRRGSVLCQRGVLGVAYWTQG